MNDNPLASLLLLGESGVLRYFFRAPAYPLLGNIDGHVIGVRSESALIERLSQLPLDMTANKRYDFIDIAGGTYYLYPETMILSPLANRFKPWTKLELIRMVNARTNSTPNAPPYSERSLGAKRFDVIFLELVARCEGTNE